MRAVVVALVLVARVASANVGPRSFPGDPAGEPEGIDVAITREDLTIDMRPLADQRGLVKVNATYHLDNTGAAKPLDLVFVLGSGMRSFDITLDGKSLPQAPSNMNLPESWKPPGTTPPPTGEYIAYGMREKALPIGFQVTIPSGRHDLVVAYDGNPTRSHHDGPTLLYQFAYVLAPAKTWKSFGGLQLTVHVPAGWEIAATPALARSGDTLTGKFDAVPADAIALAANAPHAVYTVVSILARIVFALVALGGLFLVTWHTRVIERRRHASGTLPSKADAFARGFIWAIAFCASGVFAVLGPDIFLPEGQADHYGYGQGFAIVGIVLGTFLAIPIGWVVSYAAARRAHPTTA